MFLVQALSLSLLFVWLGQCPVDSHRPPKPKPKPKPDFYTQKLTSYFSHTDANGDGFLSKTDYDTIGHIFIYTVHLTRYDAKILLKKKIPMVKFNTNLDTIYFTFISQFNYNEYTHKSTTVCTLTVPVPSLDKGGGGRS